MTQKNPLIKNIKDHIKILKKDQKQIFNKGNLLKKMIVDCFNAKGKLLVFGNGGSAADAQHLATELMGGMTDHDRKPIPSIALTTDSSFLTAWSNDTDFESVFSRQIQGLGEKGDVLVGISTSGNSKNVINALKQAKYKNLKTISLTGKTGGNLDGVGDITIKVPSNDTQRIQESHIMIGQILCSLLELSLVKK